MLILSNNDVQHCSINCQMSGTTRTLAAIKYNQHLFVKVESYSAEHSQNAISKCRQFLDRQVPILSVILKEPTGYSVWCSNRNLNLVTPQNVSTISETSNSVKKEDSTLTKKCLAVLSVVSLLLCF